MIIDYLSKHLTYPIPLADVRWFLCKLMRASLETTKILWTPHFSILVQGTVQLTAIKWAGVGPLRTCWTQFRSVADLNGPKTSPPGELFKRNLLDPILTTMNSTSDFEVHQSFRPATDPKKSVAERWTIPKSAFDSDEVHRKLFLLSADFTFQQSPTAGKWTQYHWNGLRTSKMDWTPLA